MDRKLYGKVIFKGVIKTLTGLHIGASKEVLEIGGIDAPVIKHPITREPYIPGSSLKGKLRSLLEMKVYTKKEHTKNGLEFKFDRNVGTKENPICIHVCNSAKQACDCPVCRIFGASGKESKDKNFPSRIKISDATMTEFSKEFCQNGTEIKFENSLDRITSASNPRQIERVPAGTEFEFEIIYNVENLEQLKEDINNILSSMELLEDDALGGHGSRGYGRIKFYFSEVIAKPIDVYFNEGKETFIIKKEWDSTQPIDGQKLLQLEDVKKEFLEQIDQVSWEKS